jgi:hypothetical protein
MKQMKELDAENARLAKEQPMVTQAQKDRRNAFEHEAAKAAGITPERYDWLRSRTPNRTIRDTIQKVTTDAIYGKPIVGTPHADHIVPMYEIVRMPGFNKLTEKNMIEVLNLDKNFWALDARVNTSKGGRTLGAWKGYQDPDFGPPPNLPKLLADEETARSAVKAKILELLAKQPGAPTP